MKTSTNGQTLRLNGPTMGTRFAVEAFAPAELDSAELLRALQAQVDRLDRQLSTWRADSELMRFNRAPLNQWQTLSEELFELLLAALRVEHLSAGAFDCAVGDWVRDWGFSGEPAQTPPPVRVKVSARQALSLDLEGRRVLKKYPVSLDLCGIAKGYAVDQLSRYLERQGINRYLVSLDGELRAGLAKPDGSDWCIALEEPREGVRAAHALLGIEQMAVASSGDYRQGYWQGSRRISHTIDPARGEPLDSVLCAVTVLCASATYADAWATALLVSGPERGRQLALEQGLAAIFLVRQANHWQELRVGI